jgi:hypothetical protein
LFSSIISVIAEIGGLLSLFLGFSLLSIVEAVFLIGSWLLVVLDRWWTGTGDEESDESAAKVNVIQVGYDESLDDKVNWIKILE